MKKILNVLGILGSSILTVVLSLLVFVYAVILNVKFLVSENGMVKTLKKTDIVETLKSTEDGLLWEDFKGLADTLNLTEEQFEQILNSNKVKEQVGSYINEIISSLFNDKEASLTKDKIEKFLNIAVDEYNKVSDIKISDAERQEIINSFDEEMIENMNEEFSSLNLTNTVEPEYVKYIELADNMLFGHYTLIILVSIIAIISLIALFRFSYYKWMPYVQTSTILAGSLMLIIGILLSIIPMQDMEMILPIKNVLMTNVYITSATLFIISIGLSIGKKKIKMYIENKKEKTIKDDIIEAEKEIAEEEKETDNSKKKTDKKTLIIIGLILVLLLIILFLIFGRKGSYTITFDTNGGNEIASIEVKNNEIVKLPEDPVKEGYTFIGWTNEEGNILTEGTKLTDDVTLKAEWISNDAKTITADFNTDGGNEIDNILIEKGKIILLPIDPTRDGYIFVGWIDANGYLITENMIVNNNITLKAMWINKDAKTATVKFDTDGGNKVGSIIVENGKVILLPIDPTKDGYAFAGWVDEDGNVITKDTIVNKNITIKATWKEPYTCPSGCTPIGDGSKCTKTSIKDIVTYTGCPTGTETVEKFCSAHKRQVAIGFDEDMTYETAGIICNGNPTGFCVDYNGRYTVAGESCPSGYYKYIDSDGLGALYGCAKKYDKGGSSCPSGYTKDGNKCTKTETISCTAN